MAIHDFILPSAGASLHVNDLLAVGWIGFSLLPQVDVALGMALLSSQCFLELKNTILSIVIGSTVFFEIIGPVITHRALKHVKNVEPTFINMGSR